MADFVLVNQAPIEVILDGGLRGEQGPPGDAADTLVESVNGQQGIVVLDTDDISDTSSANKYVTSAEKTKLSNLSGTNTGDQDLSGLVPKTTTVNGHALSSNVTVTKSDVSLGNVDNTSDVNKPISTATQTALDAKQNSLGFTPENITNKSTSTSLGSSDTLYPTQNAVKSYVDTQVAAVEGSDVDSFNGRTGTVLPVSGDYTATQITNSPSGTIAATDVQTAINELGTEKEEVANKSTSTALGASNTLYPSQGAVKTYVDTLDAQNVKLTGTQTVAGDKTFSGNTTLQAITTISQGFRFGASNRTTALTLASNSAVLNFCNATTAGFTITLPTATGRPGQMFYFKKTDATANVVTITRSGTETIDGAVSQTLTTQYAALTLVSDGANWFIGL